MTIGDIQGARKKSRQSDTILYGFRKWQVRRSVTELIRKNTGHIFLLEHYLLRRSVWHIMMMVIISMLSCNIVVVCRKNTRYLILTRCVISGPAKSTPTICNTTVSANQYLARIRFRIYFSQFQRKQSVTLQWKLQQGDFPASLTEIEQSECVCCRVKLLIYSRVILPSV